MVKAEMAKAVSERSLVELVRRTRERMRLAVQIALESATSLVESCTREVERDGQIWLDFSDPVMDYMAEIEDELRFLELSERLRRHPTEPKLVQLMDFEEDE